jgi:transcriptional regulator with XRE-family HTH domain
MAQSPDSTDGSRPGTDEFLIGSKLREWRLAAGRTLSDIAEASSLSIGYISQIERGMANPSLETLKRLADELDRRTVYRARRRIHTVPVRGHSTRDA